MRRPSTLRPRARGLAACALLLGIAAHSTALALDARRLLPPVAPARGNAAAAGSSAGQQRAAAAAVTPPPAKPKPPPLQQQSAASKPPQQQQQQQPSFWQAQDGSGGAVYISESARVTHAGGRYETADGDGGMAVADNARVAASSGSTANAAGPRHDGNGSGGTQVGDAGLANAAHAVYTAGGWLQVPAAQQQPSTPVMRP